MRILQLTDLHVFSEPDMRLKGIPTRECLQEVVAFIARHEAPFDHVIITGDHTHDELPESYEAVREILAEWQDRIWQVPGNHDDRAVMRRVFSHRIAGAPDARVHFEFKCGSWLMLGLDTQLPGEVAGLIQTDQITWLKQRLDASSVTRVALFFHHPPVELGSPWMDITGLEGRELLHTVIMADERIRLVCCGHVHHESHAVIGAADVYTTPSTGLQFDPAGSVANFATAPPGYRVIEIDGEDFTTHVVTLPEIRYTPVNE